MCEYDSGEWNLYSVCLSYFELEEIRFFVNYTNFEKNSGWFGRSMNDSLIIFRCEVKRNEVKWDIGDEMSQLKYCDRCDEDDCLRFFKYR